jgi:signal transduction histidine kinase/PAS domain-containing protein
MKETNYIETHKIDWQASLHVFETIPDLYLILSPEFHILTASNAYLWALSKPREVLLNTPIDIVCSIYTEDEQTLYDLVACLIAVVQTGESQSMPVQRFDGLKRNAVNMAVENYWQVSNTPVKDENGNILYIIHKIRDVTDVVENEKMHQGLLNEESKKLAASADLLRKAEEVGNSGSYQMNVQTHDISFSDGMYKLLGFERSGFRLTIDFLNSISHPDDAGLIDQVVNRAIATKQPFKYVRRVYSPEGEIRYIQSKGRVILDEMEDPYCITGVSQDITQRTLSDQALAKTHEALSKSNDLLQSIFDTTLIGMSLLQPIRKPNGDIKEFIIMLVSKELEKETGRTDLVGKNYSQEYPGIKKTGLWELMLKVMETGISEHIEYNYPYDGFNKWYSCTFVKMDDFIVASNLDISPIRHAEAKIKAMEEAQKLEVFKATLRTEEEERNRIAEDLRNGIGQLLYAVKMNLPLMEASLTNTNRAAFSEVKEQTDKILAEAIKEIRRLSHQMTPAILSDFGLEETIKDLCRQFAPKLTIASRFIGLNSRFERYIEVSVYRMVQELVFNIVSHAKASKASVELKYADNQLCLDVRDNGIGFLPEMVIGKGIGLATLHNKVRLLNGQIDIKNDKGTAVLIKIPVKLNAS